MSNLQTYYHFKLDFQKVDQHTRGKWLIHGTKRRKDNQLQSLELLKLTIVLSFATWKNALPREGEILYEWHCLVSYINSYLFEYTYQSYMINKLMYADMHKWYHIVKFIDSKLVFYW